mmetsp:Transcript_13653/g.22541  ORF Transcript_13653/g.22541 Transcript_13653/m.22541 type:complete len:96 (+) Transcript_13653:1872-2159(+)
MSYHGDSPLAMRAQPPWKNPNPHVLGVCIVHEHGLRAAGGEEGHEVVAQPAVGSHHHVRVARQQQVSDEAREVRVREEIRQNEYVGGVLGEAAPP